MQTSTTWPTTHIATPAKVEKYSFPHAATAFLLGFGAILYIPVLGDIKVVDLCAILAWTTRVSYLRFDNRAFTCLVTCFLLVCAAGFYSHFATTSMKPYLAAIAALVSAHVVVSMRSYEIRLLLAGLAISTTLVLLWTALSGYLPIPTFGLNLRYYSRFGAAYTGTMTDPNRFCLALLITLSLVVSLAITQKKAFLFWMWAFFILAGAYLTQSRAGMGLAILIVALGGGILLTKKQITQKVGIIGKLIPAFVVAALAVLSVRTIIQVTVISDNFRSSRLGEKISDKGTSLENDPRWQMAMQGISSFTENPLGLGMDGYLNRYYETSHNSYIELAVNGGGLAIAVYLLFLWTTGGKVLNSLNRSRQKLPGLWYGYFGFLCFVAIALFQFTMQIHYLSFAYIILGLLANPLLHLESRCTKRVLPSIQ
ncbi:O-antigen ligase family protein [Aureliella helgolandensis]|uniref:O-Antigen ligase n=1 Tax=Aureliella helgolandensis TaxID=2527968 RepID=A0A518GC10_9BACT|nr:O-antigen ligase family protein [Aureliella helgolandensis]QDV26135.1 O-Antigen ligase [Aureliella helgolandensis]